MVQAGWRGRLYDDGNLNPLTLHLRRIAGGGIAPMTLIVIYVLKRARMRAPPARKRKEGQVVAGVGLGYVMSMDYAGPFEMDVDGNKHFLAGVEVAHTKLGFVELTRDK